MTLIGVDLGRASTDVVLYPGRLVRQLQATIGERPLRFRLLDIEAVGGGSLARVEDFRNMILEHVP